MSRRFYPLLLIVALLLATAGCGGSASAGDSSKLTVLDYYADEPSHSQWGKRLSDCAKTVGATVNHQSVPGAQLIAKVLQQASSRTLPDLLMLDNPDVQQIASTGALLPLNDLGVTADGFSPGIVSAGTYQGKLYAATPAVNTIVLFYDKDVLAKAGVKPPTTWAELRAAAKKLTVPGRYGLAFDANADYEGAWTFLPFMWSNGGNENKLDSPQVQQSLQFWVDLFRDGSVSKGALNWRQSDVNDQFMAGKAAMMVNGPWQIQTLNKKATLHWDTVKIPVPAAGATAVAPLGGEMWTVPQSTSKERQQKAAKVVACLIQDKNMLATAKEGFLIPTKPAVARQYAADVPSMASFVDTVGHARARTGQLGPKWPKAAQAIYTAFQAALTGQSTPAAALAQAQKTVTSS
ncbi:sugar ABC transporter substrate-binding protein [Fodinicola acaciae]|uniref:sugar ABC transporter substrate-binding protein n=1 Tax=Fodinicola acaciae TaxID=2681555 RepID=UPI00165275AE|nr:extracellular solute-binding protein [Fodinicola acaciae]